MIEIWEPRYRDRTVLVASHKMPSRADIELNITRGAYKGRYFVDGDYARSCTKEKMKTKNGGEIEVVVIPLDKLRKVEVINESFCSSSN